VYYGGYGTTSESTLQAVLGMYQNNAWSDLFPSSLNTNSSIIYMLAGYDGIYDNIFVANNSNAVLNGEKLSK